MNSNSKRLGDAELEIMQTIWASDDPVTSGYILKQLHGKRSWQQSTLMTSLYRLEDKGFVICDRTTGSNLYSAAVEENEYKASTGKNVLKRLYNNSLGNLVASLYQGKVIGQNDIDELRRYLDRLESEKDD